MDLQKLKRVLNAMEIAYIKFYDSYNCGYNCTLGGDGHLGFKVSEETKQKISKSNTGKKRSAEAKLKMSEIQKGKGCKKVKQFTKDNKFIREWPSILEAENTLGISHGSVSRCCSGKAKSTRGFIWKFSNNDNE